MIKNHKGTKLLGKRATLWFLLFAKPIISKQQNPADYIRSFLRDIFPDFINDVFLVRSLLFILKNFIANRCNVYFNTIATTISF